MEKKVLSSYHLKQIVMQVWQDGDEEFDLSVGGGHKERLTYTKYLNVKFFSWRKDFYKTTTARALVETVGDNAATEAVDYSDKSGRVTFVELEDRAEILDFYIQKLRTKFSGLPIEYEIAPSNKVKLFVSIGTLSYDKPPEATSIGRAITASFDIRVSFDRSRPQIKYEMALIDNPFDAGSVNTRWFPNQAEQQAWFLARVNASPAPFTETKAPNTSSLNIPAQTYYAPDTADLNSLLSLNYAIIRKTAGEVVEWFYYFVTSANGSADNQVSVGLYLDTVQTYMFKPEIEFSPCTISRAHLNRWVDNGDGTVKFNNSPESALLNFEGGDVPKRLLSRRELWFGIDLDNGQLNSFLAQQKLNWCTVLFSPSSSVQNALGFNKNHTLKIKDFDTGLICVTFPLNGSKNSIEFPVYDGQGELEDEYYWNSTEMFYLFRENETIRSSVLSFKITPVCPLLVDSHTSKNTYSVNTYSSGTILSIYDEAAFGISLGKDLNNQVRAVALTKQSEVPAFIDVETGFQNTFLKTEIINSSSDPKYIPKMLSPSCAEFNITDYMGNVYSYDVQKINTNKVRILATELMSADLTKGYMRIQDLGKNSIYDNGCEYNYTGLAYSNDTSIPYSTTAMGDFINQNKNFALMQQANRNYDRETTKITQNYMELRTATSFISSAAQGDVGGMIGNMVNGELSRHESQANLNARDKFSKLNEKLTLDNMRSSPGSLKNAQGNILFSSLIGKSAYVAFYLDIYQALPSDMSKLLDYYNAFGFSYERIGNIKDFINTRAFYNYIQADVEDISGVSVGNEARGDLRRRLAHGVRFWKQDKVDYITTENYELSLV